MRILVIKAIRDLWRSKLRSVSIMLAIMLSVSIGIGLVNATYDAIRSFDNRTGSTNYQDIAVRFDTTTLNTSGIEAIEGVDEVMTRIFIRTQMSWEGEDYKANWILSPYHDRAPYALINGVQIAEGEYLSHPGALECMVGNQFASARGIGVGDRIGIYAGTALVNLTVTAIVASPEYIYVVDEAGWPQPSLLAPIFSSYGLARSILELPEGHCNELLITVEDGKDPETVKTAVEAHLMGIGLNLTSSLLGTQEPDYQFSRTDATAMGQTGWAFGIVILGVTGVVIYNSMTRLIASQRTYIGVMGALGGKMSSVLTHYTLFGFFLGLAGSLPGILFGYLISLGTILAYAGAIGLVDPITSLNWAYPLAFCALGVLLSTLAAFLGALRVMWVGPKEALYSNYRMTDFSRKPLIERLVDPLIGNRRILPRTILRNVSRHRVRTLMTVLALAVSMILVFASLALTTGFDQPLRRNYERYEMYDLKVTLTGRMTSAELMANLSDAGQYGMSVEPMAEEYVPVRRGDSLDFVRVQAFMSDSEMRHFNVISGKADPTSGVLMGSILSKDLGIGVGEKVEFVFGNGTLGVPVTGITGELMDDSVLMTLDQLKMVFPGERTVNAIIVKVGSNDRETVESYLRERVPVESFAYSGDVIDGIRSLMESITAMMGMFIIFGVMAEALFIGTTVVLNILDREDEFVNLRAMGARPWSVRRMVVMETLGMLVMGTIIGLPLSFITTKWIMEYMAGDLMYYVLQVPVGIYVLTTIIALVSGVVTAYLSARHIARIRIADHIRNRFTA